MIESTLLLPEWPSPPGVNAAMTTRAGGVSRGKFESMNLGWHVGDHARLVAKNRHILQTRLGLTEQLNWMNQVHGAVCVAVKENNTMPLEADAAWTNAAGVGLVVMVADCLPLLLAHRSGKEIAVVHAGWRGLAAGVIESAVAKFRDRDLIAWLGPAIGPCHYEVDSLVKNAFSEDPGFAPGKDDEHWMLDLYALASNRLRQAGVTDIYGGGFCTRCESERFFSFRRDGETGRMAAIIWKNQGLPAASIPSNSRG